MPAPPATKTASHSRTGLKELNSPDSMQLSSFLKQIFVDQERNHIVKVISVLRVLSDTDSQLCNTTARGTRL